MDRQTFLKKRIFDGFEVDLSDYPISNISYSKGKELVDYKIYGNSSQSGTPSPDSPIDIVSVGDLVTSGTYKGKYKIPVKLSNGTNTITTNIYLNAPLRKVDNYNDYLDFNSGKVIRNVGSITLNGTETGWVLYSQLSNSLHQMYISKSIISGKSSTSCNSSIAPYGMTISGRFKTPYLGCFLVSSGASIGFNLFAWTSTITVDEWKTWLASHNVEVNYILATPTAESIILPEIQTLENSNTLTIDTTLSPTSLDIKYKSKIKLGESL